MDLPRTLICVRTAHRSVGEPRDRSSFAARSAVDAVPESVESLTRRSFSGWQQAFSLRDSACSLSIPRCWYRSAQSISNQRNFADSLRLPTVEITEQASESFPTLDGTDRSPGLRPSFVPVVMRVLFLPRMCAAGVRAHRQRLAGFPNRLPGIQHRVGVPELTHNLLGHIDRRTHYSHSSKVEKSSQWEQLGVYSRCVSAQSQCP